MDDLVDQLVETWHTNQRINLFLLEHISDEGMAATLSKGGGRTVARQFAHLHNQRLYHLEGRAPTLAEGLSKLDARSEPERRALVAALDASADGIAAFVRACATGVGPGGRDPGRLRPFKKGITANIGYLIAHESHHRGSVLLTLKECGLSPPPKIRSAIWNWDRR